MQFTDTTIISIAITSTFPLVSFRFTFKLKLNPNDMLKDSRVSNACMYIRYIDVELKWTIVKVMILTIQLICLSNVC